MRTSCMILALFVAIVTSGCAFHTTAEEWNGRVGADGEPIYFTTTTQVGANLLIVVPFLGRLGIDGMVKELTAEVRNKGGDQLEIVQGDSENYWYGFSPFTWIVSPVVSTLAATYRPSKAQFRKDCAIRREQRIKDDDMTGQVIGSATYRERMAMPADATVRLQLVRTFEGDGAPYVLDEYEIYQPANVPVPFELRYDPSDIDAEGVYAVRADIHVGGKVMWRTTSDVKVITGGATGAVEVVLTREPERPGT